MPNPNIKITVLRKALYKAIIGHSAANYTDMVTTSKGYEQAKIKEISKRNNEGNHRIFLILI